MPLGSTILLTRLVVTCYYCC